MERKNILADFAMIHRLICILGTIALIIAAVSCIRTVNEAKSYNVDFSAVKETEDEDGTGHLLLRGLSLRKGNYDIKIGYVTDSDAGVEISLDNDTFITDVLPQTPQEGESRDYWVEIATGTDRGRIDFSYPEGSKLNLAYITITSDKPMFWDGLIWGLFLIVLIPCLWIGMYFFIRSTHKISLIIAILIVIVQVFPFVMKSGLNMGIDTRAHMMRIEGIFYGLLDGQFPVVVCPEWNNSYGQIGVLYPNVFLYIPAIFRLFGMSQLGTFKLFMYIVIISSALIALACSRRIFKREWQICLSVVIICLDDMRLYNMLGDGRFGGALLAEMFYPLVVAGLIELFYHDKNKWYLLAYGIAGIFCCHIMSATIICAMVALFALCCVKRFRERKLLYPSIKAVFLFIGLILGTMVCFLRFYFSDWGQEKLQWEEFTETLFPRGYAPDDIRWVYVITLLIICIICLVILYRRRFIHNIGNSYVVPTMICAVVMLFMSTAAFPWKLLCRIPAVHYYANMLQDAYRFLSLVCCLLAFCIPGLLEDVVSSVEGRRTYNSRTAVSTGIVIAVLCVINFGIANYEFFYGNKFGRLYYDQVIGETEYQLDDYLPEGTRSEWYESDAGYISDEDAVSSLAYKRSGTYVYYSYTNSKKGSYVEFPRFFYEGYTARDEMSENMDVFKGDHNRTRVYLKVTDTPAVIRMWYHVPWYMTLTCSFSLALWVLSILKIGLKLYNRIS